MKNPTFKSRTSNCSVSLALSNLNMKSYNRKSRYMEYLGYFLEHKRRQMFNKIRASLSITPEGDFSPRTEVLETLIQHLIDEQRHTQLDKLPLFVTHRSYSKVKCNCLNGVAWNIHMSFLVATMKFTIYNASVHWLRAVKLWYFLLHSRLFLTHWATVLKERRIWTYWGCEGIRPPKYSPKQQAVLWQHSGGTINRMYRAWELKAQVSNEPWMNRVLWHLLVGYYVEVFELAWRIHAL